MVATCGVPDGSSGPYPVGCGARRLRWPLEVEMPISDHSAPTEPVVVGVDGSTSSLAAVDLAAREAARRNRSLRLVHAFIWPYLHVPLGAPPYGPSEGGLRQQAERILADACTRAHTAAPGLTVHSEMVV